MPEFLSSTFFAFVAWMDSHAGVASWVQGIGSILAIVAAIIIANRQNRSLLAQAKKQHVLQVKKLYDSFWSVAMNCVTHFGRIETNFKKNPVEYFRNEFTTTGIDRALRTLDGFPFHDLPDYKSVKAALEVRERQHALLEVAIKLQNSAQDYSEVAFKDLMNSFSTHLSAFETELNDFESRKDHYLARAH